MLTRIKFVAMIRLFKEADSRERLATREADHGEEYKQLPVCDEREKLGVATLKGPGKRKNEAQPSGATAAALRCNKVSRVMATIAARLLEVPHLGFLVDFGIVGSKP